MFFLLRAGAARGRGGVRGVAARTKKMYVEPVRYLGQLYFRRIKCIFVESNEADELIFVGSSADENITFVSSALTRPTKISLISLAWVNRQTSLVVFVGSL
jgi:hypothetical protein